MQNRKFFILSACFGLVLMASTAMAGSMHLHTHHALIASGAPLHSHVHKAVSPFEVKPGDKRLHCELLGHNPLLPCPQHKVPEKGKDDCYLTNECDGGPFQAPASESAGKSPRFLIPLVSVEDNQRIAVKVSGLTVLYDSSLSNSLDRPPRAF